MEKSLVIFMPFALERRTVKKTATMIITAATTPTPIPISAPVLSDEPLLSAEGTVDPPVLAAPLLSVPCGVPVLVELKEDAETDMDVVATEEKSGNGFCGPDRCTSGAAVNRASSSPQQ